MNKRTSILLLVAVGLGLFCFLPFILLADSLSPSNGPLYTLSSILATLNSRLSTAFSFQQITLSCIVFYCLFLLVLVLTVLEIVYIIRSKNYLSFFCLGTWVVFGLLFSFYAFILFDEGFLPDFELTGGETIHYSTGLVYPVHLYEAHLISGWQLFWNMLFIVNGLAGFVVLSLTTVENLSDLASILGDEIQKKETLKQYPDREATRVLLNEASFALESDIGSKVVLASPNDLEGLYSCFCSCRDKMIKEGDNLWNRGYPTKEAFERDILDGVQYVYKEDDCIMGGYGVAFDALDYFYPKTHNLKEYRKLLKRMGIKDMNTPCLLIERFLVDPAFQRKRIGEKMLRKIKADFPGRLYIAVSGVDSKSNSFYAKEGFKYHGYVMGEWDREDPKPEFTLYSSF